MSFATVINCMDGRVQNCINDYVKNDTNHPFIDTITLAGPCKVIADEQKRSILENMRFRIDISVVKHGSDYIAIVGHFDCAGVPESDEAQIEYIKESARKLKSWYPNVKVEGLWVSDDLKVTPIKY